MSILGNQPKVLDGLVPGCNTAAAPPSSARCRARRGLQACRREGPLPHPPTSASSTLYRAVPACVTGGVCSRHPHGLASAPGARPAQTNRPRLHGRPRAAMQARTSCALDRRQRAEARNMAKLKNVTSPSNTSGSRPAFTGGPRYKFVVRGPGCTYAAAIALLQLFL